MKLDIYQVDAFAEKQFEGNPAAIVPLDQWLPDKTMVAIAEENNLSETAFFVPTNKGYHIRWFTPKKEVKLCGHATLASAFILWEEGIVSKYEHIIFYAKGGKLDVRRVGACIHMNFPISKPKKVKDFSKTRLKELLLNTCDIYQSERDIVYILESEDEVKKYIPNIFVMNKHPYRMNIITSTTSDDGIDFVSRVFAPSAGVDEDPATGIAQCILGPLWGKKLNKRVLRANQLSTRGAMFDLNIEDDRIQLIGQARLVLKGNMYV